MASRRRVSRLPSPASTSSRVREVWSKVQLPELPDARMLTRRLMDPPAESVGDASNKNATLASWQTLGGDVNTKICDY
jgi:hypothetical protein